MNELDMSMLPILIPIIVLQLLLMVIGLVDVIHNERINKSQKVVWAIVVVAVQIIGPVVYLVVSNLQKKGADE